MTKKKFEKGLQDIKSNLERIDLSNNVLGIFIKLPPSFLFFNSKTFLFINFNLETSNTKKLGPEEAKELAKAIKKSATLRILKIKRRIFLNFKRN